VCFEDVSGNTKPNPVKNLFSASAPCQLPVGCEGCNCTRRCAQFV